MTNSKAFPFFTQRCIGQITDTVEITFKVLLKQLDWGLAQV